MTRPMTLAGVNLAYMRLVGLPLACEEWNTFVVTYRVKAEADVESTLERLEPLWKQCRPTCFQRGAVLLSIGYIPPPP